VHLRIGSEKEGQVYKSIVVGTDGSGTATEAVRHAARLAQLAGATLHVVHAYQAVSPLASIGPDAGALAMASGVREAAAQQASEIIGRAKREAADEGAAVETHIRPGDPATVLLETAQEEGADLIVVGNQGMSGVKRFVLGSVPNTVSHRCPCNLLIVHTA
jgi:nucleotide-binding universal stress UspA family protein